MAVVWGNDYLRAIKIFNYLLIKRAIFRFVSITRLRGRGARVVGARNGTYGTRGIRFDEFGAPYRLIRFETPKD